MPKEDTQFKPGQSGNPSGRPKGMTKAQAISRVFDLVLALPLEDLIQREDGKTNFTRLQEELQKLFETSPAAFIMRMWYPLAQMMNKAKIEIDIKPKRPLQIVLSNGNGKAGGNGHGKVVDVEGSTESDEGASKQR